MITPLIPKQGGQRLRYLNLPKIPEEIINRISFNFKDYTIEKTYSDGNFNWSQSFSEEISDWCVENVCNLNWGFQLITADLKMHIDNIVKTKLIYIIEPGGDNVLTNFYDDDFNLTHSYKIMPRTWHLLKVDVYHNVVNIEPGKTRLSLSGPAFR
jgi:hypothetical protein